MNSNKPPSDLKKLYNNINDLQLKTEKLSNGQRYAAINEIDKALIPLKKDLKSLERELHKRENIDIEIQGQCKTLETEITNLENIKSDLNARIQTENDHTRQELNDKIISHINELKTQNEIMIKDFKSYIDEKIIPIEKEMINLQNKTNNNSYDIDKLVEKMEEYSDKLAKNSEQESKKTKTIITTIAAILAAFTTISLWLEPALHVLINVFF